MKIMWHFIKGAVLILSLIIALTGALLPPPEVETLEGIESVNGSNANMTCSIAESRKNCPLFDGYSPNINTTLPNWASHLVTLRKNGRTDSINNNHVLLTFTFATNVTLTFVELDFFLCPEWNINAPYVTIYGGSDDLVLNSQGTNSDFIANYRPSNTSCGCLSTVSVPLQLGEPSYDTWHIIVSFYYQPEAEWVHIGEIRFPNKPLLSDSVPTTFCRIPDTLPESTSIVMPTTVSTRYGLSPPSSIPTTTSTPIHTKLISPAMNRTLFPTTLINSTLDGTPLPTTLIRSAPSMSPTHTTLINLIPISTTIPTTQTIQSTPSLSIPTTSSSPMFTTAITSSEANIASVISTPLTITLVSSVLSHIPSMLFSSAQPTTTSLPSMPVSSRANTIPIFSRIFTSVQPTTTPLPSMSVSSQVNGILISSPMLSSAQPTTTFILSMPVSSQPNSIPTPSARVSSERPFTTPIPTLPVGSVLTNSPMPSGSALQITSTVLTVVVSSVMDNPSIGGSAQSITTTLLDTSTPNIYPIPSETQQISTTLPTVPVSPLLNTAATSFTLCQPIGTPVPNTQASSAPYSSIHRPKNSTQHISQPLQNSTLSCFQVTTSAPSNTSSVPTVLPDIAPLPPIIHVLDIHTGTEQTNDGGNGGPPLLIVIIAAVITGLCVFVLIVIIMIGLYFRRRELVYMKETSRSSGSELQLTVYNPLYVCASVLTEGVYTDSFDQSDFTGSGKQELSENDKPQVLFPIFSDPMLTTEDSQQPVEITSDNIMNEIWELGVGRFGEVVLAYTKGLCLQDAQLTMTDTDQDVSIAVAVKKLTPDLSQAEQEAFHMEINLLSQIQHPNMLRLLGVCYHDPAFIMMEYMEEGDLNQFLKRYAEIVTTPTSDTQISISTLVYMASQIAKAMLYLNASEFDYIHRDLATRSCLVGKDFKVKVANLGVNLKTYESHYYSICGKRLMPIRWMATECFSGKFSEKSDVWAFGVTMWELFTLAKDVPYPHLSDDEVIQNALKDKDQQFPSRPAICPQPIYQTMQQCWIIDLQQRATFREVNVMLQT